MESKRKFTEFLLKFISKFWENSHFYGYSNKELLQNNVHIHFFYQVTVVINVFTSVCNEDINTSTAITELILKLNTGQQARETKQEGRNLKREEE